MSMSPPAGAAGPAPAGASGYGLSPTPGAVLSPAPPAPGSTYNGPAVLSDDGTYPSVAPGTPVLEVSNVAVRFGGLQALREATLTVGAGMVTGLIGPNGAGKTTLFNVITGLQRPDRGSISLSGKDITSLGTDKRARLGMARTFQRLELFWSLSVLENVQVGAEAQSRIGTLNRARELLERVGIGHLAAERADSLPTGAARLVELARALAIGPKVLLLDEPGSGLDDAESVALGNLLLDLARSGMAVLIVEHDMDLLMRVCSQVFVLDFGEMIARGSPAQIQANPLVQAAYLGTEIGSDDPPVQQPPAQQFQAQTSRPQQFTPQPASAPAAVPPAAYQVMQPQVTQPQAVPQQRQPPIVQSQQFTPQPASAPATVPPFVMPVGSGEHGAQAPTDQAQQSSPRQAPSPVAAATVEESVSKGNLWAPPSPVDTSSSAPGADPPGGRT